MSENNGAKPGNGVENEKVVTAATPTETGVVDEVVMVIEQGEARPVALENIEKGLTALWQAATKANPDDANKAVMRACVFNLVICVDGDEQLAQATETVAQITWSYPCRALVLVRKPEEAQSETTASISAHCQLPTATGNRVCCEQITIVGTGQAADGLWSMVLPLLVPDLPVVLWWPGDPCIHEALFDRLLETADRLIVDSRAFIDPGATFTRLAQLVGTGHKVAFSDLSWSRLNTWRLNMAEFFDQPEFLPYLSHIDRLEIHYEAPENHQHPNFSEALLLIGWLAYQLGWQPAFGLQNRGNDASLILNQAGAPLSVTLHGHNDRMDDLGGITRMNIYASRTVTDEAEAPLRSATFTIALSDEYDHAITTVQQDNEPAVTRKVMFTKPSRTDLLCENLAVVRHDHLYESSLELAGHFSQK